MAMADVVKLIWKHEGPRQFPIQSRRASAHKRFQICSRSNFPKLPCCQWIPPPLCKEGGQQTPSGAMLLCETSTHFLDDRGCTSISWVFHELSTPDSQQANRICILFAGAMLFWARVLVRMRADALFEIPLYVQLLEKSKRQVRCDLKFCNMTLLVVFLIHSRNDGEKISWWIHGVVCREYTTN